MQVAHRSGLVGSLALTLVLLGCGTPDETKPPVKVPPPDTEIEIDPAPGGIRRLTDSQLINSVSDLLGPTAAAQLSLPDSPQLHGFESIAANELTTTTNEVQNLESTFTTVLDTTIGDLTTVATVVPCVNNPTDACYNDVAVTFGRMAWRRPLADDEVARLVSLAAAGKTWGGGDFDQGLKYEMMAIFQSPNFLYLTEVGEVDAATGQRNLTGYEMASRMSYFIINRTPGADLLAAADKGDLTTDDGIRAAAARLLGQPEAVYALDRFYGELYYLRDLPDVEKDPTLYPEYDAALAASMEESTLRFIRDIVWTRNADARELFTSKSLFVDSHTAPIYGLPAPASDWQEVTVDDSQKRAGIIGQIGYLARFAHPGLTSPTRRGRFIQERLLCNEIPPPPPGQNTSIPDEQPGMPQTMKEKLSQHQSDPKCAACHDQMDPLGYALENYDSIGRFRADDRGLTLDTSGAVANVANGAIFNNASELGALLHDDPDATLCMIKNFVRGSMGHLETKGENEALQALQQSFTTNGYSLKGAMADLCTSPMFRRVGDPK